MDTRLLKATNDEGGTLTAQLASTETTTAHITPVPDKAPGVITHEPGTTNEEAIYYKSRDSGAGTISGLTRDYTNINGGAGKLHDNGSDWETLQATEYMNNIVDALMEGFYLEHQTSVKVTTASFTVEGNQTAFYTAGRQIRINGSINAVVSSSSYSSPNTTVIVEGTPISAAITSVELAIQPKGASDIVAVRKATSTQIIAGLSDINLITPKGLFDAGITPGGHWIADTDTWVYVAANQFKITGKDVTSRFPKGTRIYWYEGATLKYGVVVLSAFSTDTTVTILTNTDYVITNTTLLTPYYSYELCPPGYPGWFAMAAPTWTLTEIDNASGGQPTTTQCRGKVEGNTFTCHIRGTGTKVGAGASYSMAVTGFPTIANTSSYMGVGSCYSAYSTTSIMGAISFITGYYYFVYSASIPDNSDFSSGQGGTFSYEI